MSFIGNTIIKPLVTIHPMSMESLGAYLYTAGNAALENFLSAAYISANRAIYIPFSVSSPILVVKLWSFNGATASGNIDVGIYDTAGTKIISSGSTVQAGTNTLQEFDIADTMLGPGNFYLAVAMDNTTGTLFRNSGGSTSLQSAVGMAQQATAFPLPATATFAATGSTYVPMVGLTTRVVV